MFILRRLTLVLTLTVLVLTSSVSLASVKTKTVKFTGPVLNKCDIYQIAESEFVVKLSGKKLPPPESSSDGNSLVITFRDSKVYHPEKMVEALNREVHEAIPLIYGVKAENISDDEGFHAQITINSNVPVKAHSISRAYSGYSIRVKSEADEVLSLSNAYVPPPKTLPVPDTKLPFNVSDRITLELRDASLVEVIRGIMAYIGRNVIIDPSFPKRIVRAEQTIDNGGVKVTEVANQEHDLVLTMTLNDVRVDEVMNYIMGAYDIACYVSGMNTLTFGSREGLYKLSGKNSAKSFKINFADPEKVSSMLKILAAVEDSAITIDERLKTIYVKTNPAKMQEVEELIGVLDAPEKQVMIQANIFEYGENDSVTVQNALNIAYNDIRIALGGETGVKIDYRSDRSPTGRDVWTNKVITDTFTALEQKTKGKVIANPSVIALDGKQAEINLTQDYPYVSDRDNEKGTVTWATEEVGPKLSFTPRIGRDGFVTLTLEISTGEVVGTQTSSTGEQMPVTTTRSVKTEVRVRDGMPFVVGGLFRENQSNTVSRIPILGNIPFLGELFTYNRNPVKTKTQVVMVITPYVLEGN